MNLLLLMAALTLVGGCEKKGAEVAQATQLYSDQTNIEIVFTNKTKEVKSVILNGRFSLTGVSGFRSTIEQSVVAGSDKTLFTLSPNSVDKIFDIIVTYPDGTRSAFVSALPGDVKNAGTYTQTLDLASVKARSPIIQSWSFDDSNPLLNLIRETSSDDYIGIIADPATPDNRVLKMTIPANLGDRTEFLWAETMTPHRAYYFYSNDRKTLSHEEEFWLGFKIYYPQEVTYMQNNIPSIFQIGPASRAVNFAGSVGLYQLTYPTNGDAYRWRMYDYPEYTMNGNITKYIGNKQFDKWTQFVIHCRLRSDDYGLIEIWSDGRMIYRYDKANAVAGIRSVIKWGVYIGMGNLSEDNLTCYFDDIIIGNYMATYNDMTLR